MAWFQLALLLLACLHGRSLAGSVPLAVLHVSCSIKLEDRALLIIDEAQELYRPQRRADGLWTILKSLGQGVGQGSPLPPLRVVLAVLYGMSPSGISISVPEAAAAMQCQQQPGELLGQSPGEPRPAHSSDSPLVSPMSFPVQNTILLRQHTDARAP